MQVKTFEADNMKEAVRAIKREFGQDAVILSTKSKTGQGAGQDSIIVTAAIPEKGRTQGATVRSVGSTHGGHDMTDANSVSMEALGRVQSLENKVTALSETLANRAQMYSLETGLKEVRALLLDVLRNNATDTEGDLPPVIFDIYRQLKAHGVDDVYLANCIKAMTSLEPTPEVQAGGPDALKDFYRSQAIRWMLRRIKISPRVSQLPGTTAIHAIMGPSGIGKTSLIAKLAHHLVTKEKQKVLIASFDNERLAGHEQLRLYSKIVGAPFVTLTSADDLAAKISQYPGLDIVLIDTSGKSIKQNDSLNDLMSLKACSMPVELHLALSVTDKPEQHDRAVQYFARTGIQSLIFTRMDESWSFGEVFNLSQRWSIPLSYFSMGPKIPDDMERATRERVVERIFGL